MTVQDRSFLEQMKADILRRAEEAQYEDSEDEDDDEPEAAVEVAEASVEKTAQQGR